MHSDSPASCLVTRTTTSPGTRPRTGALASLASRAALVTFTCAALVACGQPGSGSTDVPAKEAAPSTSSPSAASGAAAGASALGSSPAPSAASAAASAASSDATPGGAVAVAPSSTPTSSPPVAPSGAPSASGAPAASAAASGTAAATSTAAASATPEPALTVQSAKTQEAAFSVWMSSAKSYKVGQAGSVEVVLVPRGEYHCNEAYPYKVKLGAAPAGVTYGSEIVRGASVSASRAAIRVPFTATAAGDARISGKFHFSVCTADQCVIDSREVATTVKIE